MSKDEIEALREETQKKIMRLGVQFQKKTGLTITECIFFKKGDIEGGYCVEPEKILHVVIETKP